MRFHLTRAQAHDLAWAKPMREVAGLVGTSDVGLAKALRSAGIPVPPQGYWNRVAAGKAENRIALAPQDLGTPLYVHIPGQLKAPVRALIAGEPGQLTEQEETEPLDVLSDRFRKRLGKLDVSQFRTRHPEILRVMSNAERVNARNKGSIWGPILDGPQEERRLQFINALLGAAETYGSGGYLRCSHEHIDVHLTFGGLTVSMEVRHRDAAKQQLEIVLEHHGYGPAPKGWMDSPSAPLENRFTDIVVEIAQFGMLMRRRIDEQSKQQAEREAVRLADISRKSRIAEEEAKKAAKLEAKEHAVKALIGIAENKQKADTIRELLAELSTDPELPSSDEMRAWRAWAVAQADALDPLRNGDLKRLMVLTLDAATESE